MLAAKERCAPVCDVEGIVRELVEDGGEDERVSVYAAYLPLYPPHLLKWAVEELTWRSAQPDGVGVVQRGRSYYLMLYWD